MLYAAWMLLGASMAMTLYEPAFSVLTKRYPRPLRARHHARSTLVAGFASTLSFPAVLWLVSALDWRSALAVIGAVLLLADRAAARLGAGRPGVRRRAPVLRRRPRKRQRLPTDATLAAALRQRSVLAARRRLRAVRLRRRGAVGAPDVGAGGARPHAGARSVCHRRLDRPGAGGSGGCCTCYLRPQAVGRAASASSSWRCIPVRAARARRRRTASSPSSASRSCSAPSTASSPSCAARSSRPTSAAATSDASAALMAAIALLALAAAPIGGRVAAATARRLSRDADGAGAGRGGCVRELCAGACAARSQSQVPVVADNAARSGPPLERHACRSRASSGSASGSCCRAARGSSAPARRPPRRCRPRRRRCARSRSVTKWTGTAPLAVCVRPRRPLR